MSTSQTVTRLIDRWYPPGHHPYRHYSALVASRLEPRSVLLDYGCGRTAPDLAQFVGKAGRLIGAEIVDYAGADDRLELIKLVPSDNPGVFSIPLEDRTVDVVIARSVIEHVTDPLSTFNEIARVLKPGGRFIFLTANKYDYASIAAMLIPNRLHARVVKATEGRDEADTFPTAYRANTRSALIDLAGRTGFRVERIDFRNQYPNYLTFFLPLFLLGVAYERVTSAFGALEQLRGWLLCEFIRDNQAARAER